MREIKFRGKRTDNGEWVYGYFIYDTENDEAFIMEHFEDKSGYYRQVDPATVGQYTGIKDKTGVEIYEGDIVLYGEEEASVVFHESEFSLQFSNTKYIQHGLLTSTSFRPIEVIGNIHDNPDLLEL